MTLLSSEPVVARIQEFRRLLAGSGYLSYYLAFGNGNKRRNEWQRYAQNLKPPLRDLVELFLLNGRLETGLVLGLLGKDVYQELLDAEILAEDNGFTSTDKYILICFNSLVFFCEHQRHPSIYFGKDSVALGTYQIPRVDGMGLDLCAGSAIQAMNLALRCKKVHAVEINERAAKIAQFNTCLNSLADKVQTHNLSLEEFAVQNDDAFDLIVFNPPLLPVPKSLHYPFVGDGGPDGLRVTKNILKEYIPKLNAGGSIEFIGCGLGRDGSPTFVEDLSGILGEHRISGYTMLMGKSYLKPGDPLYDSLVVTAALSSNIPLDLSYSVYEVHFEKLEVNELYFFFMRAENDTLREFVCDENMAIMDLSHHASTNSDWFVQS